MRSTSTAIVPVPRRAIAVVAPISISFSLGPMSVSRAAALAREIGLVRAELKLRKLVFVRPHVRGWPRRAS